MPLPGFQEIVLDEFPGLRTLEDFRDVPHALGAVVAENIEYLGGGSGYRSRSGTSTAFDLTGGTNIVHGEKVYVNTARYFLWLMDDGKIYYSTEGARTLLFTPPVGTTHFKAVTYGTKVIIMSSDGLTGLGEPTIWDLTNVDPLTVEGQSLSGMTVASSATAGTVTAGVKRLSIVYETRHGFRIPACPSAILTNTANPADGETVTMVWTIYTFKDTLSAAYHVKRGATASESFDNLKAAINDTGVEGVNYGTGTGAHPYFRARAKTATTLVIETLNANEDPGHLGLAEASTVLSWGPGAALPGYYSHFAVNYVEFTAGTALALDVASIPVHVNSSVTIRHLTLTETDLLVPYIARTIEDNTTTALTFDISDAKLAQQTIATPYYDVKQPGPWGKTGKLYHERLCYVDGTSKLWVSEPTLFHTVYLTTGFIDCYADSEDRPNSLAEIRDVLYIMKAQKTFYTQDTGDDPVTWPLGAISKAMGSISIYGLDEEANTQMVAVTDFRSAYVWSGGEPIDIGLPIKTDWDTQTYAHMHKALVAMDPLRRQIFFFLPVSASTTPNRVFVYDYTRGITPDRGQWSVWFTAGTAWRGFLVDHKSSNFVALLVYGAASTVRKVDPAAYTDNGTAFVWKRREGFAELMESGLGLYGGLEGKFEGGGSLAIEIFGPDAASLATPTAITLAAAAGQDNRRLFHVWKERVFVQLSQSAQSAVFKLHRLVLYAQAIGMRNHG